MQSLNQLRTDKSSNNVWLECWLAYWNQWLCTSKLFSEHLMTKKRFLCFQLQVQSAYPRGSANEVEMLHIYSYMYFNYGLSMVGKGITPRSLEWKCSLALVFACLGFFPALEPLAEIAGWFHPHTSSNESVCTRSFTDVHMLISASRRVYTGPSHLRQGHCTHSSWQTSHSLLSCSPSPPSCSESWGLSLLLFILPSQEMKEKKEREMSVQGPACSRSNDASAGGVVGWMDGWIECRRERGEGAAGVGGRKDEMKVERSVEGSLKSSLRKTLFKTGLLVLFMSPTSVISPPSCLSEPNDATRYQ